MSSAPPTKPPPFDAQAFARESEARLRAEASEAHRPTTKLGAAMSAVPERILGRDDEGWFEVEGDLALVLGAVDGERSLADIAAAVPVSESDTLRAAFELATLKLIRFR